MSNTDCESLMPNVLSKSVLPDIVLPELSYLILKRLGVKILVDFGYGLVIFRGLVHIG